LVQAFPKKWWVESDFTAPSLPLPLRLKGSGCHYNSIFYNTGTNIGIIVVNAVLYENPSFITVSEEKTHLTTYSQHSRQNGENKQKLISTF
jgi:hypothetical protein